MKFGAKKDLEQMQKDGLLYCNTITYFSRLEDESRGDPFESVIKLKYFENAIFQIRPANDPSEEWKNLNATNVSYNEHYKEPLGNLFCMSAFKMPIGKEVSTFHFDERFFKFEYCLMIMNEPLFMKRLGSALEKLPVKSCKNHIEYVDLKKYSGKKTLFQKDIKYNWQEEFRIVLNTEHYRVDDPYKFSIGSIEDISQIFDLKKTKKLEYKL
jgi:hypothetical protein